MSGSGEEFDYVGALVSDNNKWISPVAVKHAPITLPECMRYSSFGFFTEEQDLPSFQLHPYHDLSRFPDQRKEWIKFLTHLHERKKVAIVPIGEWELIINFPFASPDSTTSVKVCYRKLTTNKVGWKPGPPQVEQVLHPPPGRARGPPARGHGVGPLAHPAQANASKVHPQYLETLSQTHSSWAFGGLAELVDNARDAGATKVSIDITMVKMKDMVETSPMLTVEDNGQGMTHEEIVRMLGLGHSTPDDTNKDRIGRFGVGFKTGSMRLAKDALVLTYSENSRSIGFLSKSYNEGKENLEVPIVTYRKVHGVMEMDLNAQSERAGQASLEAVKKFTPFGEFEIGSRFEKMSNTGSQSGTCIFLFNLRKWGDQYALDWTDEDIAMRSKRVRNRPGQTSKQVPLDYSLRSYLEVVFLDPRMSIRIQGSKVKSIRLSSSLNTTRIYKWQSSKNVGKETVLTLGRSALEYDRGNCGMFLYWHGRLIEAYKRVGGMEHSADKGRGVIGVLDVTNLMGKTKERIGVLNTKQGFDDSEEYALLEKWLGDEFNDYWGKYIDKVEVMSSDFSKCEPDLDWVQCDKCLKWRKLRKGVQSYTIPDEWFCYMKPFSKSCQEKEEKQEEDVVTIGVYRSESILDVRVKEEDVEDEESYRPLIIPRKLPQSVVQVLLGEASEQKVDSSNDLLPRRKRLKRKFVEQP